MAKLLDASKGLATASKEIDKLERQFNKLENLQSVALTINTIVAAKLTRMLQAMLLANYSKGGIHVITGVLKAAVAASYIVVSDKGLKVQLGRRFPKSVYISASVFRKYKDWYELTASDMAQLQNEFTRLWQLEVNARFKS